MGRRLPTDTTAGSPGERQLAEHRPSQIGIAGHRDTKRRADLTHRYPEKRYGRITVLLHSGFT